MNFFFRTGQFSKKAIGFKDIKTGKEKRDILRIAAVKWHA